MIVPNGRTHWRFAAFLWLVLAIGGLILNPLTLIIGSLFPDTDIKGPLISKFIPLWLFFKHRGPLHTIGALLLFSCLVWWAWNFLAGVSFAVGYFSHLMLDSTTPYGIRWVTGKRKGRS